MHSKKVLPKGLRQKRNADNPAVSLLIATEHSQELEGISEMPEENLSNAKVPRKNSPLKKMGSTYSVAKGGGNIDSLEQSILNGQSMG